jgi:hypothetical protein
LPDAILFPEIQRSFSTRTKVLYFLIGTQFFRLFSGCEVRYGTRFSMYMVSLTGKGIKKTDRAQ